LQNIIGLFNSRSDAESAVHQLVNSGVNRDHISIVSRDSNEDTRNLKTDDDTSGAAKGAGIGAALGGVGGLLAGLAGLAIPGIGPILAAGPIAAALGGALGGAGLGAAAGGLIGALTDMGVPEHEARHYEDAVRQGKTLLTVRSEDDAAAERVADILDSCGAIDIEGDGNRDRTERAGVFGGEPDSPVAEMREREALSHDEVDQPGYQRVARPADFDRNIDVQSADLRADASRESDNIRSNSESATIPVKEEELVVGKRKVEGARVRIYGRIVEKPVEQSVQLHDERIVVERRAVDRPVSDADRDTQTVTEIREIREEPVIGKQERVVEEVVVGRTGEDRTETVRDKVRRTEVEVERSGGEEAGHERQR
jgi:stress response protein YsnF